MARRTGALLIILAATVGYGFFRLDTARFEPGPTVALLQSNMLQRQKQKKPLTADDILTIFKHLIEKAWAAEVKPDLLVWPETAFPLQYIEIDPKLSPDEFARQVHAYDPEGTPAYWTGRRDEVNKILHGWTDGIKIPMMVGISTCHFRPGGLNRFNAAMLLEPGKTTTQSYHKLHLVPFGEYVPLLQTFPWLTGLTPYRNGYVPSLTFGGVPSWFEQGRYRYATAICFEDTVPQVTRRLFAEIPDGRSPDVLLNLSNDGWFTTQDENNVVHASSEQEMHLAGSVFRAVEHRVPLARAANTGISAVIDGNGKVIASLPGAKEDVLVAMVPLDPRTGLYTRWGDWVGLFCLAVTIGLIPLAWSRGGRELKPAPLPA
jgi:apolipoprotein N-acyltransferase